MSHIEFPPDAQSENLNIEITPDELLCLQVMADNSSLSARTVGNHIPDGTRSHQWASWQLRMLVKKGLATRNRRDQYNFCDPHWEYRIISAGRTKLEEAIEQSDGPLILKIHHNEMPAD